MDKQCFFSINYGMYIISSVNGDRLNGQIANTVFQVTADPPQLAVAINVKNLTHEYIKKSRVFTVSVLDKQAPMTLIGLFGFKSGKDVDKFKEIKYRTGITKAPVVLEHTTGYFECELVSSQQVGTHTLFIGRVIEAQKLSEGEPMTYGYYHEVKKGKSPENAPTYMK